MGLRQQASVRLTQRLIQPPARQPACRIAELHSAGRGYVQRRWAFGRSADCKSAIQQIENLRYAYARRGVIRSRLLSAREGYEIAKLRRQARSVKAAAEIRRGISKFKRAGLVKNVSNGRPMGKISGGFNYISSVGSARDGGLKEAVWKQGTGPTASESSRGSTRNHLPRTNANCWFLAAAQAANPLSC